MKILSPRNYVVSVEIISDAQNACNTVFIIRRRCRIRIVRINERMYIV